MSEDGVRREEREIETNNWRGWSITEKIQCHLSPEKRVLRGWFTLSNNFLVVHIKYNDFLKEYLLMTLIAGTSTNDFM